MTRSRFLFISAVVVGALHGACGGEGEEVLVQTATVQIISTMRPAYLACEDNPGTEADETTTEPDNTNATPHNPRRKLYWLGLCDQMKMRWTKLQFPAGGGAVNVCDPPGIVPVEPPLTLVKAANGDRAEFVYVAEYAPGHLGCEQETGARTSSNLGPFPANYTDINADYLLQLVVVDTRATITDDDEWEPPLDDPALQRIASQRIAFVGETDKVMAPRVLNPTEECERYDPNDSTLCLERAYSWSGLAHVPPDEIPENIDDYIFDIEAFSPKIRIKSVRVVEGHIGGVPAAGVERNLYPSNDASFECTRDTNSVDGCKSIAFEWVQATARFFLCLNPNPEGQQDTVNILEGCMNPLDGGGIDLKEVEANPILLYNAVSPSETGEFPRWLINFNADAGVPPPAADENGRIPDLAVTFILESL